MPRTLVLAHTAGHLHDMHVAILYIAIAELVYITEEAPYNYIILYYSYVLPTAVWKVVRDELTFTPFPKLISKLFNIVYILIFQNTQNRAPV